jgi:hypothetical protein
MLGNRCRVLHYYDWLIWRVCQLFYIVQGVIWIIIMFSRLIYLANIRSRVHVRNVCLAVMFAFPCFVCFDTIAFDLMITDLNTSLAGSLRVTGPWKRDTGPRLAKITNISGCVDLCYICRLLLGIGQVASSSCKFTVPTTWQVSAYASVGQIYQSWIRGFMWTASGIGLSIGLTSGLAFLIRVRKVSDCNVGPEIQFPQEIAGVINM